MNALSLRFANNLYSEMGDGNLFFSPHSIFNALSILYLGANKKTAQEMQDVLGPSKSDIKKWFVDISSDKDSGDDYRLHADNRIWVNRNDKILKSFEDKIQEIFKAGFQNIDFDIDAREIINSWVSDQTHLHITELIPENIIDKMTSLIVTNAIYFKGAWETAFDCSNTKDSPFLISETSQVNVPMMSITGLFNYAWDGEIQIVELPYKGGDLSMWVFLPRKGLGSINHIGAFCKLHTLEFRSQELRISLPKFKLSSQLDLSPILQNMGMQTAFGSNANFSGISDSQLYISSVQHQAVVGVDEIGTEAAAATSANCFRCISMPITFEANHPFLFMIRHEPSETILFMGRVVNP